MDPSRYGNRTQENQIARVANPQSQIDALTIRDITDRKRTEEALKVKDSAIASSLNGIAMADPQGCLTYVNRAFLRLWGYEDEGGLLGKSVLDLWAEPKRATEVIQAIRNGGGWTGELVAIRKDGSHLDLHLSACTVLNDAGTPICMMASFVDISDRKRAEQRLKELNAALEQRAAERTAELRRREESLRESEAKYRALAENIRDVVYSTDAEGHLTYVSPQASQYGLVPEELIGHSFEELILPEDRQRVQEDFLKLLSTDETFPTEFRILDSAGRIRWLEDHSQVLRDQAGRIVGVSGTVREITERKEAQSVAELYSQRVRHLAMKLSLAEEQERRRLAATLHDDLVQVLVAIKMRFALLRRAGDESARLQQVQEVEALVSRVIQVARSLMSQLSHRALYDMGFVPAVRWLTEDIQTLYRLKVTMKDDGKPKPMAEPVRVLLYQCLREALVNAAKHAQVEEAHVHIRRDGSVVRVVVEDKGVGFDPSVIGPKPDGSGFGLFSIEERLEPLGGKMDIRSAPGQGTTILLEVPVGSEENDA